MIFPCEHEREFMETYSLKGRKFAPHRFHKIAWNAHLAMQTLRVILNVEKDEFSVMAEG